MRKEINERALNYLLGELSVTDPWLEKDVVLDLAAQSWFRSFEELHIPCRLEGDTEPTEVELSIVSASRVCS